jgi:hypothetical protein
MTPRFVRALPAIAVVLIASIHVVGAQVTEPVLQAERPSDRDPFCAVSVTASSALPLVTQLHAIGATVSARVFVFSSSEAYTADIPTLPLSGAGLVKATSTFAIVSDKPIAPRYMYIDSYRLDGGAQIDCPTEPVAFIDGPFVPASTPAQVSALQVPVADAGPLPTATCGAVMKKASIRKAVAPGDYDRSFDHIRVKVLVYVNAAGRLVRADILKASMSNPDNNLAVEAAQKSTYFPAMFYCKPVVGSYLFDATFDRMDGLQPP